MSNKNKEAFEQMKRLTKAAKEFYGSNYNPGTLYPPRDTKFLLDEEYIPFDFETDYDDPLYTEYRRVRMLENPFEDMKEIEPKQEVKGIGDYMAENVADIVYGADKALSGATFGGYDWLKRKTGIGIDEDKYLSNKKQSGNYIATKVGGTIAEIGGNILGGGGALVRGLGKAGLRGLSHASTIGAIGGGLYGITSSDNIKQLPYNTAIGTIGGGLLGGVGYLGYQGANNLYNNTLLPRYNSWQIGRGYDRLIKNPYYGSGSDVIARMKNHNGENVLLQRGEAIPGEGGKVITSGKALKRETGTERNYGLNKAIYKHGMSRDEVKNIPYNISRKPFETSARGQDIYIVSVPDGNTKTVSTPFYGKKTITSFYKDIR